jgi:TIGR03009 family protein
MRPYGSVLTALLLTALPAAAQTPPAGGARPTTPTTPTPAASSAALDRYLLRWEQEMQKVRTLAAQLTLKEKDKTFETTKVYSGVAQYMKQGTGPSALNLAVLEMKQDGRPDVTKKFVCTGTYLYAFEPSVKELRAYELPTPKAGQVADDNFLAFLFGMSRDQAKRRYVLKLFKEDKYYIYVDVEPRSSQDRAEFQRARLVLNRDTFLPRQLWFEQPNGNEVLWDIPSVRSGVALERRLFDAPATPAGWKLVPVSRTGPAATPRVVRPSR